MTVMRQEAPYPDALAALVAELHVEDLRRWSFRLDDDCGRHAGAHGLTLIITVETADAYRPGEPYTVTHYFWVPAESYDRAGWQRWLLDQCLLVDRHEIMEGFMIGGRRPFAPGHGGGHSPYHAAP
jgi:hypothetical protein